jgi:hypothetical protein
MPFGSYETPKPPTVPTFLQYVKTVSKKGIEGKTRFNVEIIWLPGKFDNVTLQTHAFRYVAEPNNQLYQDVIDYVDNLERQTSRLQIVITSFDKKTIEVTENPKDEIIWVPLGNNAFKVS